MNQNESNIDNNLQKAIDDITNTTSVDPVFSDPVAAPSSVPEGDTGELSAPVGPFPEPKLEMVAPAPEPIAPLDAMSGVPELTMPPVPPVTPPTEPVTPVEPVMPVAPTPTPVTESHSYNTSEVKRAALHDLIPLVDKVNMTPEQKFAIYKNIFEDLRDYTVLDPAYRVARDIPDETKRAEALLYLIESIDKM